MKHKTTPEEMRQHKAELLIRRAYETMTPAERLAQLDAADPSQQRPQRRPCIWDGVDMVSHDNHRDLGTHPLQRIRNYGYGIYPKKF